MRRQWFARRSGLYLDIQIQSQPTTKALPTSPSAFSERTLPQSPPQQFIVIYQTIGPKPFLLPNECIITNLTNWSPNMNTSVMFAT